MHERLGFGNLEWKLYSLTSSRWKAQVLPQRLLLAWCFKSLILPIDPPAVIDQAGETFFPLTIARRIHRFRESQIRQHGPSSSTSRIAVDRGGWNIPKPSRLLLHFQWSTFSFNQDRPNYHRSTRFSLNIVYNIDVFGLCLSSASPEIPTKSKMLRMTFLWTTCIIAYLSHQHLPYGWSCWNRFPDVLLVSSP